MAMEDPRILYNSMSFNPFRSHHPSPSRSCPPQIPQRIESDSTNDSWHTNAPAYPSSPPLAAADGVNQQQQYQQHHHHHDSNNRPSPLRSPSRASSAISWFSSWTASSTTTITTSPASASTLQNVSASTRAAAASSGIIINDPESSNSSHAVGVTTISSPAKSMSMHRGIHSLEKHATGSQSYQGHGGGNVVPPLPLHNNSLVTSAAAAAAAGGGCMPIIQQQQEPNANEIPLNKLPPSTDELQNEGSFRTGDDNKFNENFHSSFGSGNTELILPPYPKVLSKTCAPKTQIIDSTPRTNKSLICEFPNESGVPPPPTVVAAATVNSVDKAKNKSLICVSSKGMSKLLSQHLQQKEQQNENEAFPGFALYQTATAQQTMGHLSKALDATTECLLFQKVALVHSGNNSGSNSHHGTPVTSIRKGSGDANDGNNVAATTTMTPLDLRSSSLTGVASSLVGVVQSFSSPNASATASAHGQSPPRHQQNQYHQSPKHPQNHPMLSNSITNMIAQYPTHSCIAQTLFLRGRLLAQCGLIDGDSSLLQQAVQHVQMAIAIQRKVLLLSNSSPSSLIIINANKEEMASPLLFLGNIKCTLGQFDEADAAYEEAISILKEVQSCAKMYHLDAITMDNVPGSVTRDAITTDAITMHGKDDEKEKIRLDCTKYLKRITKDFGHAMHLHGKAYHCQRMYSQAFGCYNKALCLFRKSNVGNSNSQSRGNGSSWKNRSNVKIIGRCMKSRYALEKLVSAYWDDPCII